MLGLYCSAAFRELGYETVYCSGNHIQRSEFLKRIGVIPIYNRKKIYIFENMKIIFILFFRQAKYDMRKR
jgi:hypothetical protein